MSLWNFWWTESSHSASTLISFFRSALLHHFDSWDTDIYLMWSVLSGSYFWFSSLWVGCKPQTPLWYSSSSDWPERPRIFFFFLRHQILPLQGEQLSFGAVAVLFLSPHVSPNGWNKHSDPWRLCAWCAIWVTLSHRDLPVVVRVSHSALSSVSESLEYYVADSTFFRLI